MSYADDVARSIRRDNGIKQRILASSPHLCSMDSGQLEAMSGRELAAAELKGYGLKVSENSDPIELRDAFHAGRMHEREHGAGRRPDWAQDGASGSRMGSILADYLKE